MRPRSAYSIPSGGPSNVKYQGIGPLSEQGIPLSARSQVQDEYASDWYKSMYKRLHKYEQRRKDEPIRIKVKTKKPRGELVILVTKVVFTLILLFFFFFFLFLLLVLSPSTHLLISQSTDLPQSTGSMAIISAMTRLAYRDLDTSLST